MEREAQKKISQKREQSHQNDDQRHQPDVVVADMRQFVGGDSLELCFVEFLQYPGRKNYHRVLRVAAGGKRVDRGVFYNIYLRRRQPGRDTEIFNHLVQLRRDAAVNRVGAGQRESDVGAEVITDERVADAEPDRDVENFWGPICLRKYKSQPDYQHEKRAQEQRGFSFIFGNMVVYNGHKVKN